MKHQIQRTYAFQRLISFNRDQQRKRKEAVRAVCYTLFFVIAVVVLFLAGRLG